MDWYDALNDPKSHPALLAYLHWAVAPAVERGDNPPPPLFADYHGNDPLAILLVGKRCRVVMASRFGDVGIRFTDLSKPFGYSTRCYLSDLRNFSDKP